MPKIKKEIEHSEEEKCLLSDTMIDTRREKYKIVLDCDGDEINFIQFFRKDVYDSLWSENKEEVSRAIQGRIMGLANNVMAKFGLAQNQ